MPLNGDGGAAPDIRGQEPGFRNALSISADVVDEWFERVFPLETSTER